MFGSWKRFESLGICAFEGQTNSNSDIKRPLVLDRPPSPHNCCCLPISSLGTLGVLGDSSSFLTSMIKQIAVSKNTPRSPKDPKEDMCKQQQSWEEYGPISTTGLLTSLFEFFWSSKSTFPKLSKRFYDPNIIALLHTKSMQMLTAYGSSIPTGGSAGPTAASGYGMREEKGTDTSKPHALMYTNTCRHGKKKEAG